MALLPSPDIAKQFVRALAEYLVGDQVEMSIWLQVGLKEGRQWAALRSATPLRGYPTVPEAEVVLMDFLRRTF